MTDLDSRPRRRQAPLAAPPPGRGEGAPVPTPPAPAAGDGGVQWSNLLGAGVLLGLLVLAGVFGGWPLLVMIGALVVMITLHELGHYVAAKRAGMKVTEFFIGFGPRIWSFRRGETEYGVKALWLGAYVKIVGMHNLDEYDPADVERTYLSKPYWRRMSVALAGSAMHFLLALVVLFVAVGVVGVGGGRAVMGVGDLEAVEEQIYETEAWQIGQIVEGSAAQDLGVRVGDRILSVDGEDIVGYASFAEVVSERPGRTVEVTFERDGAELSGTTVLGRRDGRGFFGIGPVPTEQRLGPVAAVRETFRAFGAGAVATFDGLSSLLSPSGLASIGSQAFGGDEPDAPAAGGGGGEALQPSGLIGITDAGAGGLRDGLYGEWLAFFAAINIFIGLFNLVPLLPLDGGHAAIATYEKIRSMLRGGEPYHVDVVKLLPLTYAVVAVLVFLGVSVLVLDTRNLIGG